MSASQRNKEEWRNSNNNNSTCYFDWFEKAEIKVFNTLKKVSEEACSSYEESESTSS